MPFSEIPMRIGPRIDFVSPRHTLRTEPALKLEVDSRRRSCRGKSAQGRKYEGQQNAIKPVLQRNQQGGRSLLPTRRVCFRARARVIDVGIGDDVGLDLRVCPSSAAPLRLSLCGRLLWPTNRAPDSIKEATTAAAFVNPRCFVALGPTAPRPGPKILTRPHLRCNRTISLIPSPPRPPFPRPSPPLSPPHALRGSSTQYQPPHSTRVVGHTPNATYGATGARSTCTCHSPLRTPHSLPPRTSRASQPYRLARVTRHIPNINTAPLAFPASRVAFPVAFDTSLRTTSILGGVSPPLKLVPGPHAAGVLRPSTIPHVSSVHPIAHATSIKSPPAFPIHRSHAEQGRRHFDIAHVTCPPLHAQRRDVAAGGEHVAAHAGGRTRSRRFSCVAQRPDAPDAIQRMNAQKRPAPALFNQDCAALLPAARGSSGRLLGSPIHCTCVRASTGAGLYCLNPLLHASS
ncbi:hypothetical protein B0H14DRAFT_3133200 [Mycena olivaceomarginata]|nr:hypothetical protein B0H14DRAFT_3133200 [Mycena olivaceomarginata]